MLTVFLLHFLIMNALQVLDAATSAALLQFSNRHVANLNNNQFSYQRLVRPHPRDREKMNLDCVVAEELYDRMMLNLTITLRNLLHTVKVLVNHDISMSDVDESLCRISNDFDWARNRLPVTTDCARSITVSSPNVTLFYNDIVNGWTPYPLNFPGSTPMIQDFQMRSWTAVEVTCHFQLLVEAAGIVNELTQGNIQNYFVDFMIINSSGFGSHAFRTLSSLISVSQHPLTGNNIRSIYLGDQDPAGINIPLVTLAGVLGNDKVQNQAVHLVENLEPLIVGDLTGRVGSERLEGWDYVFFDTIDKRFVMITQNFPHINLTRWRLWATHMRVVRVKLSCIHIPNLIGFVFHHPIMVNLQQLAPGTMPPIQPTPDW